MAEAAVTAVEQGDTAAAAAEEAAAMAASAPAGADTATKRLKKPGGTPISESNSHALLWKQSIFFSHYRNL
jgi:hypothetical protein